MMCIERDFIKKILRHQLKDILRSVNQCGREGVIYIELCLTTTDSCRNVECYKLL